MQDLLIVLVSKSRPIDTASGCVVPQCHVPRDWWPTRRTRELRVEKVDLFLYEAGFADSLRF
jgi:hypothetical protein